MRAAYPGYTGKRPKIQLWHGTKDEVLNYHNLGEAVKLWTNVLDADTIPISKETNVFQTGWTRQRYTNAKNEVVVETIIEQGVSHNLQVLQDEAISFFGLDQSTDVRFRTVLKNSFLSNANIVVSSNVSGHSTITVRSVPGSASLSLYTVNGRMVYTYSAMSSSTGNYSFTIKNKTPAHIAQTSNIYIMKVRLNGFDAGFFSVALAI